MPTSPEDEKHLRTLLRHIENVRQFGLLLGERMTEIGQERLGFSLIANTQIHDHSKFYGCEWLYLRQDISDDVPSHLIEFARIQHVSTNTHHPEYWGGIEKMPEIYMAEMVCDWAARSSEVGNDLREWIREKGTKKFNMKVQSKVYKDIKRFVDILLDPSFSIKK